MEGHFIDIIIGKNVEDIGEDEEFNLDVEELSGHDDPQLEEARQNMRAFRSKRLTT